jgi:hypothetical protein
MEAVVLFISVSLKEINPHAKPQLNIPTTINAFQGSFSLTFLRFHHRNGSKMIAPARQRKNTIPHIPAEGSSHFINTKDKPQIKLSPIKAPYNRNIIHLLTSLIMANFVDYFIPKFCFVEHFLIIFIISISFFRYIKYFFFNNKFDVTHRNNSENFRVFIENGTFVLV